MVARAAPDARELSLLRAIAIEVVKKIERIRRSMAPDAMPGSGATPSDEAGGG
jgi:hypothetical protein